MPPKIPPVTPPIISVRLSTGFAGGQQKFDSSGKISKPPNSWTAQSHENGGFNEQRTIMCTFAKHRRAVSGEYYRAQIGGYYGEMVVMASIAGCGGGCDFAVEPRIPLGAVRWRTYDVSAGESIAQRGEQLQLLGHDALIVAFCVGVAQPIRYSHGPPGPA